MKKKKKKKKKKKTCGGISVGLLKSNWLQS